MKIPEIPPNEGQRLKDLCDYGILDTDSESNFDQITALAAEIFGVSFSVVSFVDQQRQWFKSRHGVSVSETPRDISFCAHAILGDEILVIPDTLKDERFSANPAVIGPPFIRFYAGAPLISPGGQRLGTLCVFHTETKTVSLSQRNILLSLARHVMAILELRKKSDQVGAYAKIFLQSVDPIMTLAPPEWRFTSANPATLKLFNVDTEDKFLALGPWDISPKYQPDGELSQIKAPRMISSAMEKGSAFFEWTHIQLSGKIMPCTVLLSRIDQGSSPYLQATVRDITEQKFLEGQFVEAQAISKIGSWSYNLTTHQQYWSEEHYKIFEISSPQPDDVLHTMYRERIHPDDLPVLDNLLTRALNYGEDFVYDHRIVFDGGSRIKFVRGKGKVQKNASGNPVSVSGTCRDRTEDVESEERHRMLLETMSEGLVILNESGVSGYNSSALKILQLSSEEISGLVSLPKGWEAIREDGSRFQLREHPGILALRTGKVIPAIRMGVRLPDNEIRWITINSVPVDGREGRYVISTFSDITPLMRAVEEHRFVLDAIGIGVWKVNLLTGEQIWDRKMYQLYGVDTKFSNTFNNWQTLLTKESSEAVDEGLSRLLSGSDTFSADLEVVNTSGQNKILGSKGQVIRNKSGEPVMIYGINWDRTKELELQKHLEIEKAKSLHHAKLASIGQLAAGVGHEINNPLAIIAGLITMTEQLLLNGSDQNVIADKFRKMESSVQRISNIVKGLRTFARSDKDDVSEFDPFLLVIETVDLLKDIYSREGVSIQIMADELPVIMKGNRGRLQQVLVNLLSNAKDSSIGMSDRNINLVVVPLSNELEIIVQDKGCGIPAGIREKIFEPFYTTKDVNMGTGIGLSLVNTIVKEHDGKIELKSELGKGTDISIRIPLISATKPMAVPLLAKKATICKINCRVLVVDDEPDLRAVLKEILSYNCTEVVTAESAREGLRILREGNIDVVLSDIKMPVLDGFDFLKAIRSEPAFAAVKFLFITGGIEMSAAELKVVKSDSDGIFYKPVKFPELFQKLKILFP